MLNFAGTKKLDGIWDFHFYEGILTNEEILNIRYDEFAVVPGCFDAASRYYGKHGTGVYRTHFSASGKIMLKFHAVGLRARLFLDGAEIGRIPYAFTPYSFVVDAGAGGEHELIVATENTLDESPSSMFHEFYDFYSFGGLYRSVEVRELADTYIERIQVIPLNPEEGLVQIKLVLNRDANENAQVFFDGKALSSVFVGKETIFECAVPSPRIWSQENPELHTVKLAIPGDSVETAFGLRTLECKDGLLLLNGKALKLTGFCRHDSHPEFGYAIPEARVLGDLKMLKEQGCNFLRGSHYKQSEFLLDCCDRLGILVWEESCGWGNWPEQCGDPVFVQYQIEQTVSMVRESGNHPSVIMWGVMNELDSRSPEARGLLEKLFQAIRAEDSSRPVTYASCRREADICYDLADIISVNLYPGWYDATVTSDNCDVVQPELRRMEAFFSRPEFRNKPWIVSEIGAAAIIGDHSGMHWSEDYQEKLIGEVLEFFFSSIRCSGLAIWLFANANTYLGTNGMFSRPRGFNNKGLLSEHRIPKLAWKSLGKKIREYSGK